MSGPGRRRSRASVRDAGATLLELMISTAVVAVIAGALLSVVATFLRNDAQASERIDESRDLQQIAVYLPSDVASAFVTELVEDSDTGDSYVDANDPDTAASCPDYTGTGTNVLGLKWSESFGGTTKQFRVDYRAETAGGETRIVRVACEGVALGPSTSAVVARQLDPAVPPEVTLNGAVVTMTLTEKTGRTLTITATSQNPRAELEYTSEFDA